MASVALAVTPQVEPRPPYWSDDLQDLLKLSHVNKPVHGSASAAASISFHPDRGVYEARRTVRAADKGLDKTLPAGWPETLQGPLAWEGADFKNDADFAFQLSASDVAEIDRALKAVKEKGLELDEINADTFPLPGIHARLQRIQDQLYNGIGFAVLRGIDADRYSRRESLRIFLGVTSHIAAARGAQDQDGNLLNHLVDYNRIDSDVELPIHTDITADIVATQTLQTSIHGGEATLASSWTVYNELAATRPDLIHTLAAPDWPFDTYGRDPPYYCRPILYHHDGKVLINYSRRVLTGHPITGRTPGIPALTEAQAEALDAIHFIAKKHKLNFPTVKGDIRLINNFALLHGREAYHDHDGATTTTTDQPSSTPSDGREQTKSQRHLHRLWLHNDRMAWKLPPALKLVWARTFSPNRHRTWEAANQILGPANPNPPPKFPCD